MFDAIKLCYVCYVFQSLNIFFALEKRADPDETPHKAAFYLDLHYLQETRSVYDSMNILKFEIIS